MNDNPVILGYDLISPLGADKEKNWQRCIDGQSGIGPLTRFRSSMGHGLSFAGEVPTISFDEFPFLTPKENALWFTPAITYSQMAVHRVLKSAGITIQGKLASRTAVTFSSTFGGMKAILDAHEKKSCENRSPHPFTNPNGCLNMVAGKISILTGATGPLYGPMAGSSTGLVSVINALILIKQGLADVVICGSVEFPLYEPLFSSFSSAGAYGGGPLHPAQIMRPFSHDAKGFVLSEGCGTILVASKRTARELGISPQVEIAGHSMNGDFNPLPARVKCLQDCLGSARISPDQVQHINSSAPSWVMEDELERKGILEIFGGREGPPVSALKSQLGHSMGASSTLELIFAIMALERQMVLPTLNHSPNEGLHENERPNIVKEARHHAMEHVLKVSFESHGIHSALLLRRIA